MRYQALLQREASAHVEVSTGNDLGEVIADARAIYVSLVPLILAEGEKVYARETHDEDDELRKTAADSVRFGWMPSYLLAAQEWGVGVYDNSKESGDELVHWLGATRNELKL